MESNNANQPDRRMKMKVQAQKPVTGITSEIISAIVAEVTNAVTALWDADVSGRVSDPANLAAGKPCTLSCYGESIAMTSSGNGVTIVYRTCGGSIHTVELDAKSGYLFTESTGRRNSTGWSMIDHSETLASLLLAEKKEGWTLLSLETSQPEWGVSHWLAGTLKPGPCNLQEWDGLANTLFQKND
jgi:hypothetical protein